MLLALVVVVAMLLAPAAAQASGKCLFKPADTVFKNGYVYTVNPWQPTAQAVAVRDGKIIYVGCNQVAMWTVGPKTNVVDLHGKMMMPGLEDGHTHLQGFIACNMNYEGGTIDYILGKIKAALQRTDQVDMLQSNYVLNCSYLAGASILPAGTQLTSHDLDRLSLPTASGDPMATGTTRPIVVSDLDGHKKWVNSKAMPNAGITSQTQTPPGSTIGHYPDGQPNGFFADFSANWGDTPPSPPNSNYVGKLTSIQLYNQKGTTSIEKASGSLNDLPIWQQMADNGDLTMRVNSQVSTSWVHGATDPAAIQARIDTMNAARAQYSGYTSPNSPGSLTVDTAKIFADGVAEYPAQTAAMLQPYNVNIGTDANPIWVPGPSSGPVPRSTMRRWASSCSTPTTGPFTCTPSATGPCATP